MQISKRCGRLVVFDASKIAQALAAAGAASAELDLPPLLRPRSTWDGVG